MEPEEETTSKTSSGGGVKDEHLMAAIAHAGVLITVIVALVIWLTQKEKSKYVEFQAKQALVYQLVVGVVLIVLWIITIILSFVVIGIFLMPVILLLSLAAVGYGLYGAYETYQGKDFRYMIIGDQLSK
ncbi:MAG: DUF4870 domain-containing protein [Candidatus Altiarchaeota archaeon]|nr:DUF4870 domain-containing protein [Candidatus Altiarchaeota archaeon]